MRIGDTYGKLQVVNRISMNSYRIYISTAFKFQEISESTYNLLKTVEVKLDNIDGQNNPYTVYCVYKGGIQQCLSKERNSKLSKV